MWRITTRTPAQTRELGARLGALLRPGDVVCLIGGLGAGKTCFTQGVAQGLGIDAYVTSPTYTLIHEYQGRLPLYHFDVYRVSEEEMDDLGYEDYFYGEGVTLIEWADKITGVLPPAYLWVEITPTEEEEERRISFFPRGERYLRLAEELKRGAGVRD